MADDNRLAARLRAYANTLLTAWLRAPGFVTWFGQPASDRRVAAADTSVRLHERHDDAGGVGPVTVRSAATSVEHGVVYVPIVRSYDGTVTGVEAQLGATGERNGPPLAPQAVAAAEQAGWIEPTGSQVLERSCRDHVQWRRAHPDVTLDLAVNVSERQLNDPDCAMTLFRIMAATGMRPASLILAVEARTFGRCSGPAIASLAELKRVGVRVAVRARPAAVARLRMLPSDIVTVDRRCVAGVARSRPAREVMAAMVRYGHRRDLTIIAEGIETAAQHRAVVTFGCELVQGSLYAPPLPSTAVGGRLDARPSRAWRLPLPTGG